MHSYNHDDMADENSSFPKRALTNQYTVTLSGQRPIPVGLDAYEGTG